MSVFDLTKEHVNFVDSATSWEEAIDISARSLVEGDFVIPEYVEEMKASVKKNGPYIVITENVAMPHARPEAGTKKIGYSITRFKEPVSFLEDGSKDAQLFITLSCVDAKTHVSIMEKIVIILSDEDKRELLFSTTSEEEIVNIFNE